MTEYLIIIISSILLGSIPTAYLIVKIIYGIDIRLTGSGNVGAYNSTKVTSSWGIGTAVFLIDAAKGLLSVFIASTLLPSDFIASAIALILSVLTHCYNPWLKFKGGRGLATAAGGSFMLYPMLLALWLLLWIIAYLFRKDTHFGNISSIVLTTALVWSSGDVINKYTYPSANDLIVFQIATTILFGIILARHWKYVREYYDRVKVKK